MAQPPQLQIFEDIICRNYVQLINSTPGAAVAVDDICKSPAVQKELALVTGWKNTFDILPCKCIQEIGTEYRANWIFDSCRSCFAIRYISR